MRFSKEQATEFFQALREASIAILDYYGLPNNPGFKTRPWEKGHPLGATFHYTAGPAWKGSAEWLNSQKNKDSSCHALILDRNLAEVQALVPDVVADVMPVLTLLLADIDRGTWHGNWSNAINFGIENRNAGKLKGSVGRWCWWARNWTQPFPHKELGKTPVDIDGRWWEPYTRGQVEANITLCQMLLALYPDMDRRWFLPHSAICKEKFDTGRAFPLEGVRAAIFDQADPQNLPWLTQFGADPLYMDDYEEQQDLEFLKELAARQGQRDEPLEDFDLAEEPPGADLQLLVEDGDWKMELPAIRRALNKLGYVPSPQSLAAFELDRDTALAVWMFQKSVGLGTDKIPGSKTQKALYERLMQFQLER